MADVGLYVFGTSILWGQGHKNSAKMHTRLAAWLRRRHRVTVRLYFAPHSGAVVAGGSNDRRLHGEVPTASPSVIRQIQEAPRATESHVVVLIDGGINDVGALNIINPMLSNTRLKQQTREACYLRMKVALTRLAAKYRQADIFVLGYYQILADRIGRHAAGLLNLFDVLNICDPDEAKKIDFVSRAVEKSKLFRKESDRHFQRAIREVGSTVDSTVTFVPSTYAALNGLFGRDSLLFNLGDRDPQFGSRVGPCTKAILKRRTKAHCYLASVGHPNKKGVTRYFNSLKQTVQ